MKQKEIIGAFFKIPIDEEQHTYGRILEGRVYAFYDYRTKEEKFDLDLVANAKILFKLIIHTSVIKKGRWEILGVKDLPEGLKQIVPFFIQEIGNKGVCWIDRFNRSYWDIQYYKNDDWDPTERNWRYIINN